MDKEVRAYVRRQWRWYAAAAWAQVATATGVSVFMFLRYGLHNSDALETLLLVNGFFVAFSFFIIDHNEDRPHSWLLSAAKFALGSWFVMFVCGGMAITSSVGDLSPIGPPCFVLAVVSVVAMVVAGRAKGRAMDRDGSLDIADSDLAVEFDVRDNNAVFTVDSTKVTLSWTVAKRRRFNERTGTWRVYRRSNNGGYIRPDRTSDGCSLGSISNPRTTYIRRPRTVPMPGDGTKLFKLSVGPALVFDSPKGTWVISVRRAQQACDAIRSKSSKYRKSAPGYQLGTFLPKNL